MIGDRIAHPGDLVKFEIDGRKVVSIFLGSVKRDPDNRKQFVCNLRLPITGKLLLMTPVDGLTVVGDIEDEIWGDADE
jgi:hypothetical protein